MSSFLFVEAKRRQNGKTTKRKVDTTTKLGRKDYKRKPLISDLICRLFAWCFVVLSSFRLEKTTERQDAKTIIFVFSPRKDDKTKSWQYDKTPSDKYNPLIRHLFAWCFVVLSTFRFVVFLGRKDDNYRFFVLSFFEAKRRQDDKTPSEKTTN
jgi:hypothetical protein